MTPPGICVSKIKCVCKCDTVYAWCGVCVYVWCCVCVMLCVWCRCDAIYVCVCCTVCDVCDVVCVSDGVCVYVMLCGMQDVYVCVVQSICMWYRTYVCVCVCVMQCMCVCDAVWVMLYVCAIESECICWQRECPESPGSPLQRLYSGPCLRALWDFPGPPSPHVSSILLYAYPASQSRLATQVLWAPPQKLLLMY